MTKVEQLIADAKRAEMDGNLKLARKLMDEAKALGKNEPLAEQNPGIGEVAGMKIGELGSGQSSENGSPTSQSEDDETGSDTGSSDPETDEPEGSQDSSNPSSEIPQDEDGNVTDPTVVDALLAETTDDESGGEADPAE
jgi:hypothetical protein